jgi:ribosomal protein S18 acetylase RimI-like enzyme
VPADASVRRARPSDVPAIAAVQARAWRQAYSDLLTEELTAQLTPDRFVTAWKAELAAATVFVATSGEAVVGVAAVRTGQTEEAGPPAAEIAALVVDPARQRQGHGSRLLSAVTDTLRQEGTGQVNTWAPSVDAARLRFLTSAGLEPDGAQRVLENGNGETVVEIRLSAVLPDDPALL